MKQYLISVEIADKDSTEVGVFRVPISAANREEAERIFRKHNPPNQIGFRHMMIEEITK